MGYGYGFNFWPERMSVGQKIANGIAAARKLAKKEGRDPQPVKPLSRKIATTFWGLQWCENLQRYHDIANRLPRGATYVRNGSVADLVIEPGKVRAIVGGTEAYRIEIKIKTLSASTWKSISRDCSRQVESLLDLLRGKFSDTVMRRLTQANGGLFPTPKEISMTCSCPDYATVCKHVAATFYGVAVRLDAEPQLLFTLRNVDHLDLIKQATKAENIDRALDGGKSDSLLDANLGDIFGIDLELSPGEGKATTKSRAKTAAKTAAKPRATTAKAKKSTPKVTKSTAATAKKAKKPTAETATTESSVTKTTASGKVSAAKKSRKGRAATSKPTAESSLTPNSPTSPTEAEKKALLADFDRAIESLEQNRRKS